MLWRKILRIVTRVFLILAVFLLLTTLFLWYLHETGRLDLLGLEPLNVFIATVISALLGLLGLLTDKRLPDPPNQPPITITAYLENPFPGLTIRGSKVLLAILGTDIKDKHQFRKMSQAYQTYEAGLTSTIMNRYGPLCQYRARHYTLRI